MIPWSVVTLVWWLAPRFGRTPRVTWTKGRFGADTLAITGRCHAYELPWNAARRTVFDMRSR